MRNPLADRTDISEQEATQRDLLFMQRSGQRGGLYEVADRKLGAGRVLVAFAVHDVDGKRYVDLEVVG